MEGWVKIFTSDQPVQIEVAKAALSENNIESVDISKKDSVYMFGDIELYVRLIDEIMAKIIIKQLDL